ncbi:MAG: hypothetical protein ABIF40_03800 [archaeon]
MKMSTLARGCTILRLWFSFLLLLLIVPGVFAAECDLEEYEYQGELVMRCNVNENIEILGNGIYLSPDDTEVRTTGSYPFTFRLSESIQTEEGFEIDVTTVETEWVKGNIGEDGIFQGISLADTFISDYNLPENFEFSYYVVDDIFEIEHFDTFEGYEYEGHTLNIAEDGVIKIQNVGGEWLISGYNFMIDDVLVKSYNSATYDGVNDKFLFDLGGDFEYAGIDFSSGQEFQLLSYEIDGVSREDFLYNFYQGELFTNENDYLMLLNEEISQTEIVPFILNGEGLTFDVTSDSLLFNFDDRNDYFKGALSQGSLFFEDLGTAHVYGNAEIQNGPYKTYFYEEGRTEMELLQRPGYNVYKTGYDIVPLSLGYVNEDGYVEEILYKESTASRGVDSLTVSTAEFYVGEDYVTDVSVETLLTEPEISTAFLTDESFEPLEGEEPEVSCLGLSFDECLYNPKGHGCFWSGGCTECNVIMCEMYSSQEECVRDPCGFNDISSKCSFEGACMSVDRIEDTVAASEILAVANIYKEASVHYSQGNWLMEEPEVNGLDCSGFAQKPWHELGVAMPARASTQAMVTRDDGTTEVKMENYFNHIECKDLKPADMLIYRPKPGVERDGHVVLVKESYGNSGAVIIHSKGGTGVTEDFLIDVENVYSPLGLELKDCWRHKSVVYE